MTLDELRTVLAAARRAGITREKAFLHVAFVWRTLTGSPLPREVVLDWPRTDWPPDAKSERAMAAGERGAWRDGFIRELSEGHPVALACDRAGVTRAMAYKARAQDFDFRLIWDAAKLEGRQRRPRHR
jgi:hypothetical protein